MSDARRRSLAVGYCEDDPGVRRLLGEALRIAGHRGVPSRECGEAMVRFEGLDLDVIILDIGLPDGDGRDLCRALRANGQTAPVVFLTAYGALRDVVGGFAAGGLDYLVKPFELAELLVRVEALGGRPRSETVTGTLALDPSGHRLRRGSDERLLTPTEFRILSALLGARARVVRRAHLAAVARPAGARAAGSTLDVYIHRLRRHLAQIGAEERIVTVRGVGYAIDTGAVGSIDRESGGGRGHVA